MVKHQMTATASAAAAAAAAFFQSNTWSDQVPQK